MHFAQLCGTSLNLVDQLNSHASCQVGFLIRGPHGAGKVLAEMFKDNSDRTWKFRFLVVKITSPCHAHIMLESYIPA
jgi:DNA-binding NtrC family response regulator